MKQDTYPIAVDPTKVGSYSALVKSGGGYFFDEVLEYRVWCHPERGAPSEFGEGDDYYYAFAKYSEALEFHNKTKGSETPLVLIRQIEHVNEPEPGKFIHVKEERIAEWQCEWLMSGSRKAGDIEKMIEKHR